MYASKSDAQRAGWFSRRFQGRDGLDRSRGERAAKLEQKFKGAQERNEASAKLTPQERLTKLDKLFGEGQEAKKERAKLQAKIDTKKD